jgi:RNA polymerase sigma factor (sigma-70 family)
VPIPLALPSQLTAAAPDFAAVYREHQGFVGRTLRHLGVDPGRVDDAVQDTFMVVHRRLAEFEGRAALRTWLFEIARRVAGRYRRTAAREAPRSCPLDELAGTRSQDEDVARVEAAEMLRVFLDELDHDKSVVFILSELEQWRAPEIAEALEMNLNTVYARLRAARKQLDRVVARVQARERRPQRRRGADVVAAAIIAVPPPGWPGSPFEPGLTAISGTAGATAPAAAGKLGLAAAATSATTWATGVAVAVAVAVFGAQRSEPPAEAPVEVAPPRARSQEPATPPVGPIVAVESLAPPMPPAPSDEPPPFAAELASLEAARAALLGGDARRALDLLARHRRRFPAGALAQEAAVTRIDALCGLGDVDAARRELESFARRWPDAARGESIDAPCR